MRAGDRTLHSEQGAVFVQVGISIFVLMAFNVFVLDYGMMWVSRRQAQNAADAGALAGAVARGYDDFADPPASDGLAANSATQTAAANLVWNEAGIPEVSFNCPTGITGRCTRVDVHRNVEHGNPIDTLFGPILGITGQGVRATATAIAAKGNATDCLRPIALPDSWQEQGSNNQFNGYIETGPDAGQPYLPAGERDSYSPPTLTQAGGSTISGNFGIILNYDLDDTTTAPTTPITRGLVVPLQLQTGTFSTNMRSCNGQVVELGDALPVPTGTPTAPEITAELDTIWTQDQYPPLRWNASQNRVDNSCAPGCAPISPRVIAVALFDPRRFQLGRALSPPDWSRPDVGCPTNSPCITVTNIAGFFIHCVSSRPCDGSTTPHGHLLRYPGMIAAGVPMLHDDASWLVTTNLIR
jgi:Flp pilus assembly protein TadG